MKFDENYQGLSINEIRQISRIEHEKSGMKITIELDSIKELDLLRYTTSQAELASELTLNPFPPSYEVEIASLVELQKGDYVVGCGEVSEGIAPTIYVRRVRKSSE